MVTAQSPEISTRTPAAGAPGAAGGAACWATIGTATNAAAATISARTTRTLISTSKSLPSLRGRCSSGGLLGLFSSLGGGLFGSELRDLLHVFRVERFLPALR